MKYAYIKKMHTILKWYNSDFSPRKSLKNKYPLITNKNDAYVLIDLRHPRKNSTRMRHNGNM